MKDEIIINFINGLLEFLYVAVEKINNSIVIRKNKINFFDLFYYMVTYNSSTKSSHQETLLKYNIENNQNIEKNTFISRLEKLDPDHIKNLNMEFIEYFYKTFNIDKTKLTCSTDGSQVKLLASLKDYFTLNKNKLYTTCYLSCVFDVDNEIPIYYDIFKSPNEIKNFKTQIKNDKNKMTYITDRGYDDKKLIQYYLENKMFFISRLVKNNVFIKKLTNGDTILNEQIFDYKIDNSVHKLKIVKYNNVNKPDIKETKDELIVNRNNLDIQINNKQNELINLKNKKRTTVNNIKEANNKNKTVIDKQLIKEHNKIIKKCRSEKNIIKNNEKVIGNEISALKEQFYKINNKIEQIINYEHSDYFILTNNTNLSLDKLKEIYRKRWMVETEFKYHKTILNLNQMDNKNVNVIKQNIYVIQFISILNAFIKKALEKYVNINRHLNNKLILTSIHDYVISLIYKTLIGKQRYNYLYKNIENNYKKKKIENECIAEKEKNINNILKILEQILKNQIPKSKFSIFKKRIKKRQSNNKFNYRKK